MYRVYNKAFARILYLFFVFFLYNNMTNIAKTTIPQRTTTTVSRITTIDSKGGLACEDGEYSANGT